VNLLAQQITIALKCRMLYSPNNTKYKKIMFRIYTEAEFLFFLSVSIDTIMAIKCIKCIHVNALKIYFHVHSGNNKLSPMGKSQWD